MIPRTWAEAEPPLTEKPWAWEHWLTDPGHMVPWCPIFRGSDHLLFKEPTPSTLSGKEFGSYMASVIVRIERLLWPLAKHQWEEEVSSSGALHWFHAVKEAQQRAHIHSKILSIRSPNKAIWSRETDHPSPSNVCLNRENHQALELCDCAAQEHISRGKDKTPPLRRADENAIWIIN